MAGTAASAATKPKRTPRAAGPKPFYLVYGISADETGKPTLNVNGVHFNAEDAMRSLQSDKSLEFYRGEIPVKSRTPSA